MRLGHGDHSLSDSESSDDGMEEEDGRVAQQSANEAAADALTSPIKHAPSPPTQPTQAATPPSAQPPLPPPSSGGASATTPSPQPAADGTAGGAAAGGAAAAAAAAESFEGNASSLSARSRETAELRQRLHSVKQQVHSQQSSPLLQPEGSAFVTSPPPIRDTESWDALQSAHAHMLLLEARLAELST